MASSAMSIAEIVTHPVRVRIIQQLGGRELTTAQLRAALPDVSQPTLYRQVAILVEAGVLTIVAERRVRGAVERTLALGERLAHIDHEGLRAMSDAQLRSAFLSFLGQVGRTFDLFLDAGDPQLREFLGFGTGSLYVNADDLATIQAGLTKVLAPYQVDQGGGRRRVDLSTILIPEAVPPADPEP
ncbi:helix-turn-helix domain-containing protein [Microlunatus parietis]|uniref:DNA-binding transcriptional ArsR family regulator n=1 Tax=Microlunatus parietis TaxID=682979 RepID=A0A7Y9LAF4_9ACTN|nr:helix-turn-helix domain-containing protein [Microlunatus parietis]NYE72794.1 DNA-binding transcriptional ArsR family regulator [Microlunatus parietis]